MDAGPITAPALPTVVIEEHRVLGVVTRLASIFRNLCYDGAVSHGSLLVDWLSGAERSETSFVTFIAMA